MREDARWSRSSIATAGGVGILPLTVAALSLAVKRRGWHYHLRLASILQLLYLGPRSSFRRRYSIAFLDQHYY